MSCSPIKIGEEQESSFNSFIYSIVKKIVPTFYDLGLTPNLITTISLYFSYWSYIYLLQKNKLCILYYIIYTILDYADGYMARMYEMQSKFGDIYDHVRDIIFHTFIFNKIIPNKKLVAIFIVSLVLSLNSFGCQEIVYEATCNNNYNSTIGWLKPFCTNNILLDEFNKVIGSGSIYLGTIIIMYIYCS
jgi:phosphatidylglycerophosphate synthase